MSSKNNYIESSYNGQKNKLLNFIKKALPLDQAEDVLQDIFIQLFNGFEQIETLDNISSWLYRTANNRIIDLKRKKKPELLSDKSADRKADGEDEKLFIEDILPASTGNPDDELFRKAIWDEILEALDELPEEQREVFILHEFEDYSFKQISDQTGEKVNTLISRKRYAIVYLRERLNEMYELLKD
ncbi:RNA polymerase sigma factor [Saccharicrinis aurantiacus]|uniref:RNA polymerase sigma factor n=1 Tax=Saccharicrinis aurantiacus TaxID=1849719 RepID=UPI0024901AB5|nr:RNA polymerase sigma factor [Saccharicrinis aurantiacus]